VQKVQKVTQMTPAQMRELAPKIMAKEYFDKKKRIIAEFERKYAEFKKN